MKSLEMSSKLASWKAKSLSQAGKMVLIKSVAQSIPVYQMSNFLLPKRICPKLDAIVRRFWWKMDPNEEKEHFLALRSWQTIFQPKNRGGLGFRKFADFNKALVTGASWTWQDVIKCAKIIKAGICFNVSTHTAINIWEDPWIPSIQDFTPKPPNNLNPQWPILVRDLIESANQWNLELLNQMFSTEVVHEIRKIQIPVEVEPSKPFWGPSKSGKFTTKSAFKTITQGSECNDPEDELVGKRI
ncbi:hypothetical protein Sango_2053200 [Sesamum angolense]|uniref:Uncharacterized protein n=1 Tax=Sesamum angolense TaxID=2727404 RepID=A0AAE1WFY4_9LAMI|nr:hypothetical protein Sango_2053200 [Sesamum angolense]